MSEYEVLNEYEIGVKWPRGIRATLVIKDAKGIPLTETHVERVEPGGTLMFHIPDHVGKLTSA